MNALDYDATLHVMFADKTTYEELPKNPTKEIEKTVNRFISKVLSDRKLNAVFGYELKCSNGICPRLYGLPKLHKEPNLPLKPIVSFINSPH